jgi:prepilin-type N-terminal cleavage/methylation domain-containing protein
MSYRNTQHGFTLVEIMVALALFSIVAVVAAGAFLKVIDANKKSQAMKAVINNINYALESMSREIRVGTTYNCDISAVEAASDCEGNLLSFESANGSPTNANDQYVYTLDNGVIVKSESSGSTGSFYPVTGSVDVKITALNFELVSPETGDDTPARVIITVSGVSGASPKIETEFSMQTTVSQRARE